MNRAAQPEGKQRKKIRPITLVIILLVVMGLGLLLYPTVRNILYQRWVNEEIEAYKISVNTADYSELWEAAEAYNAELAALRQFTSEVNVLADVSDFLNLYGTGMMGYLEIPAIDVKIPIYQGTTEAVLQAGAGFWIGTSLPTGGESTHCVLTAHTGLAKAKMFTDLDQLEIGDTFTLTILDRVLTYEVDQILVTEPSDFSALKIVEGEDYVTLYTCTPVGVNSHRLLVRGHRVIEEEEEAEEEIAQTQESASSPLPLILGLMLLVLLLALALWRMWPMPAAPAGKRARKE